MVHDNLTIVSVYGHNNGASVIPSIVKSMKELKGSKGLLISVEKPPKLPKKIAWKRCHPIDYLGYSLFMMHGLYAYIETDYCLVVQDDGWVINGKNFKPEYYEYDYIGAPSHCAFGEGNLYLKFAWTQATEPVIVVQNGGFSLRSKRFLEACNKHGIMHMNSNEIHGWNEDAQLSAILRPTLESYGYKYCPNEIAKYFSIEYVGRGFHEEGFDYSKLLGHHAQTRKLVSANHIVVPADPTESYGEIDFLGFLQDSGYTLEYRYAPVEQT
jgi:Protein of unknown function (DUF5672)